MGDRGRHGSGVGDGGRGAALRRQPLDLDDRLAAGHAGDGARLRRRVRGGRPVPQRLPRRSARRDVPARLRARASCRRRSRPAWDVAQLDAVLLTHLHGDHFGGVPFLFMEYRYETPRTRPLVIYGPQDTERRVQALFAALYEKTRRRAAAVPGRVPGAARRRDHPTSGRRRVTAIPVPSRAGAHVVRVPGRGARAGRCSTRGTPPGPTSSSAHARRRRPLHLRVLDLRDPPRHPRLLSGDRGPRARARLPPRAPHPSRQRAAAHGSTSSRSSAPGTG